MNDPLANALASLPHGPEFRFLEAITSLVPGVSGTGRYTVRGDEPFLRGHFPGEPLFPGVLLLEAAAQLAGAVAQSDPNLPPIPHLKLAAIRSAKFKGTARPGQEVTFEARVVAKLGNMVQADTSASIAGNQIMAASIALSGG